jgi:short subunit dehydrogenase-like uncharacterized protein
VIAVYGATGYTGRLVAQELRRRGLQARLCGRNGDRLRALTRELGVDWETRAAKLDDTPALQAAFAGADVVLSCAGPFTYYGAPVVEAALHNGAHYCDTTGEQGYMRGVFEHVDAPARERGLAVVPAVGFDYVPGDLAAALAARGRGPLDELVVAYAIDGLGVTRGTMHSALEMLSGGDVEYADGAHRPSGRPRLDATFAFGGDLGDRRVARYPGGEVVTVPRHVDTRAVRLWMTASTFAPHPRLVPAVAAGSVAAGALLRTPLRDAIDRIVDRLAEGPAEDARRAARFTVVADAHARDGSTQRATVRGTDIYGITAVMAVEFARRLRDGEISARGALAPAEAVDAEEFLGFLGEHGLAYEVSEPRPAAPAARA